MKPASVLKPLAFALAALMAVAAHATPPGSGALSAISDTQKSHDNSVKNEGTKNNTTTTNSVNGNSGNVGANVAAGDFNQQKNNTTLAVGPGKVSIAAADISQVSTGNRFLNESAGSGYGANPVLNNSTVTNSVNGNVGNVGFNSAAGAGNQQSNSLSISSACGGCARF